MWAFPAGRGARGAGKAAKDAPLDQVAELVKRTAFKITRMGQLVGNLAAKELGVPFGIVDLSLAPTPPSATAWPTSWKKWALRAAAAAAPPRRWPC